MPADPSGFTLVQSTRRRTKNTSRVCPPAVPTIPSRSAAPALRRPAALAAAATAATAATADFSPLASPPQEHAAASELLGAAAWRSRVDHLTAQLESTPFAQAAVSAVKAQEGLGAIACYGIGSNICSRFHSTSSNLQVALALVLVNALPTCAVHFYDPAHTPQDVAALRSLGWLLLDDPEKRQSPHTLFFMPHCDRWLYASVCRENQAADVVILGNSFLGYFAQPRVVDDCIHSLAASGRVKETPLHPLLPASAGFHLDLHALERAFNDLCIITCSA
jgi:hypothetical protein